MAKNQKAKFVLYVLLIEHILKYHQNFVDYPCLQLNYEAAVLFIFKIGNSISVLLFVVSSIWLLDYYRTQISIQLKELIPSPHCY